MAVEMALEMASYTDSDLLLCNLLYMCNRVWGGGDHQLQDQPFSVMFAIRFEALTIGIYTVSSCKFDLQANRLLDVNQ